MTSLAQYVQINDLIIPSSTYLTDRRISPSVYVEHASGRRAFGARNPFPRSSTGKTRFPRVLRETTSFVLMEENITSEGLFRVPPHSKLRDVLKEAYDRGQKYIVWKDNNATLPMPPYPSAEHQDEILAEVDPKDAYSVFMAAALIKAWYSSLREPIFPTTSYADLRRLYGDSQDVPDLRRLTDLFSPDSEWSLLPGLSREILVRHLLPLLDAVASRQEQNKMTAENLAVCFAPALLCGPDQIEDAKMSSIIRRIFSHAIDLWPKGLRDACGQSADVFYDELKLPKDDADWDDPVEEKRHSGDGMMSLEEQSGGITLEDNEKPAESYPEPYPDIPNDDEMPPPLPMRPSAKSSAESTKRKPAPPLQVPPPRYSTVISDAPEDMAESPVTFAATTDGFAPRRNDDGEAPPPLPPRTNKVSDGKTGTSYSTSVPPTSALPPTQNLKSSVPAFPAQLNVPKRKTLTAAQVDKAEESGITPNSEPLRKLSASEASRPYKPQGGMALPGLTNLPVLNTHNATSGAEEPKRAPPPKPGSQSALTSPVGGISPSSPSPTQPTSAIEFRRPSYPASANRIPTITGLARQVYPSTPSTNPLVNQPSSTTTTKSSSLPIPGPKPRSISPGLLHRMPSFETAQQQQQQRKPSSECPPRKMLTPNKLNLKKQSVEDLRRLYEERAGTASALVEAGKWSQG